MLEFFMRYYRKSVFYFLTICLTFIVSGNTQSLYAQKKPLTYPQIITALNSKVPNSVFKNKNEIVAFLIKDIKNRKVIKYPSKEIEQLLRDSGATNLLIATIKKNIKQNKIRKPNKESYNYYLQGMRNLSLAQKKKQGFDTAIKSFSNAIKLNPKFAKAFLGRGTAYIGKYKIKRELKMNNLAISDFTKAVEIDSTLAQAFYLRGLTYINQNQTKEALRDFDKTIKLKPNFVEAYISRGKFHQSNREYNKAIIDYTSAIKLNSNKADYFWYRANAYERNSEFAKAERDLRQAVKLNPSDTHFKRKLNNIRNKLGKQPI